MAYCVAGIASCFIATFVSVAATKGIRLSKLNVNTECIINFASRKMAEDVLQCIV